MWAFQERITRWVIWMEGVKAEEGATEVPESSPRLGGNSLYPKGAPSLAWMPPGWSSLLLWESWLFTWLSPHYSCLYEFPSVRLPGAEGPGLEAVPSPKVSSLPYPSPCS